MDTRILDFHVILVSLFILFFLYKTLLLVLGKKSLLYQIRQKTKTLEIGVGVLILATGAYLMNTLSVVPIHLIVKIILVVIAIPLGIIGLRRENKIITWIALLLFIYIYSIAVTKRLDFKQTQANRIAFSIEELGMNTAENILDANNSATIQQGKVIYKVLCVECHGDEGKISLPEAANLSESKLSLDEKVEIIMHGKGIMRGYDSELSEQEITLVAAYTETLK